MNAPTPPNAAVMVVLSGASAEAAHLALRYAATAAAMDLPVEMHVVSAGAVRWFVRGAADAALVTQLRQACELGLSLFVCPAALADQGVTPAQLLSEIAAVRGAASLLSTAVAPNVRVLSF